MDTCSLPTFPDSSLANLCISLHIFSIPSFLSVLWAYHSPYSLWASAPGVLPSSKANTTTPLPSPSISLYFLMPTQSSELISRNTSSEKPCRPLETRSTFPHIGLSLHISLNISKHNSKCTFIFMIYLCSMSVNLKRPQSQWRKRLLFCKTVSLALSRTDMQILLNEWINTDVLVEATQFHTIGQCCIQMGLRKIKETRITPGKHRYLGIKQRK